jgi:hypothetical protein
MGKLSGLPVMSDQPSPIVLTGKPYRAYPWHTTDRPMHFDQLISCFAKEP